MFTVNTWLKIFLFFRKTIKKKMYVKCAIEQKFKILVCMDDIAKKRKLLI